MSGLLFHPHFSNDLQRELSTAASKDSGVKARANPAFVWLVANHADKLLLKTLAKCTHFNATQGVERKPSHFTSTPPGGPEQCVVIVVGLDSKGTLRACASNAVPKPAKTDAPFPLEFFVQFDTARTIPAQVKLLQEAAASAASKEHMDWLDRVYTEGQRYRTSPILLIVLDGDKQHFYATTALLEAPLQSDRALEWTGRVTA
jgi:hypothetical protein